MAQTRREKLDKQRQRQQKVRAVRKSKRKPSRDDIARTLLHWAIVQNLKLGREQELDRLQAFVVDGLAAQGFDRGQADAAFDELVGKYSAGWTFQRKPHLRDDSVDGREDT
jgi:hypothetical protein